jgi:hypothetical protein
MDTKVTDWTLWTIKFDEYYKTYVDWTFMGWTYTVLYTEVYEQNYFMDTELLRTELRRLNLIDTEVYRLNLMDTKIYRINCT